MLCYLFLVCLKTFIGLNLSTKESWVHYEYDENIVFMSSMRSNTLTITYLYLCSVELDTNGQIGTLRVHEKLLIESLM